MSIVLAFAGGLAGSLHCIGMCGGLAALVGGAGGGRSRWVALTLYNLARINTYVALGAVAGALGTAVVHWAPFDTATRALAIAAGLFVVVVGFEWLGIVAPRGEWILTGVQRLLSSYARSLLDARSAWTPVAFGTANAFLPCHLIYAFVALAATTGSASGGAATMLAFGLGTLPAMMLAGSIRGLLERWATPAATRAAGAFVVGVGLVTIARAFGPLGAHH